MALRYRLISAFLVWAAVAIWPLGATAAERGEGSIADHISAYFNAERRELADGVAHYQFTARVGKREFDVVRIHRVVREERPGPEGGRLGAPKGNRTGPCPGRDREGAGASARCGRSAPMERCSWCTVQT